MDQKLNYFYLLIIDDHATDADVGVSIAGDLTRLLALINSERISLLFFYKYFKFTISARNNKETRLNIGLKSGVDL